MGLFVLRHVLQTSASRTKAGAGVADDWNTNNTQTHVCGQRMHTTLQQRREHFTCSFDKVLQLGMQLSGYHVPGENLYQRNPTERQLGDLLEDESSCTLEAILWCLPLIIVTKSTNPLAASRGSECCTHALLRLTLAKANEASSIRLHGHKPSLSLLTHAHPLQRKTL